MSGEGVRGKRGWKGWKWIRTSKTGGEGVILVVTDVISGAKFVNLGIEGVILSPFSNN